MVFIGDSVIVSAIIVTAIITHAIKESGTIHLAAANRAESATGYSSGLCNGISGFGNYTYLIRKKILMQNHDEQAFIGGLGTSGYDELPPLPQIKGRLRTYLQLAKVF